MEQSKKSSSISDDDIENKPLICECLVCMILLKGFSTYDLQKQKKVISSGRHIPDINLETKVKQSTKECISHFTTDIYDKFKWLTGCATFEKLFCWPCLLFNANEKIPWNWSGFSDLENFQENVKEHINSRGHLAALIKERTFERTEKETLDNQLVAKNRDFLKRLIDVICFLGKHELSISRLQKDDKPKNRDNYVGLNKLLAKYDAPFNTFLKESFGFLGDICGSGTFDISLNNLMKCIADVVFDNIKGEIKDALFVSIVLNETTDVNNVSQLSVVLSYVRLDGTEYGPVQERFLRFLDITTDRTAENVYKTVCDIVAELECSSKLVSQSYDGATVMAGHLESLQAKVKEICQSGILVNCCAHRLNSVLSRNLGHIKECKIFFSALRGMAAFFSKSKRSHALDMRIQERFPNADPIRWDCSELWFAHTVSQYREVLLEFFQATVVEKDRWDSGTVNSSRGYLQLLEDDFDFNFLLNVFSEIFPYTDLLVKFLRVKSSDTDLCAKYLDGFVRKLEQKRDRFQYFWEKLSDFNPEPRRKRIKIENEGDRETYYSLLFLQIWDNITQQLRERFQDYNKLKFFELCNFKGYKSRFPEEAFDSLKITYGDFFDTAALHSQLNVLYDSPEISKQETALDMLLFLKATGLEESYSEVFKLCQLVLTIPAINVWKNHTFSNVDRVKDFIMNLKGEEILSDLAVIFIENKYIRDLSQHAKFYEDVIDKYAKLNKA